MKIFLLMMVAMAVFSTQAMAAPAQAKESPPKDKAMKMERMAGMEKKMRCAKCMVGPMMGVMVQGMIMQNVMRTIQDIARIQDRVLAGMTEEEKRAAQAELKLLVGRLDKMMTEMPGMMMRGMTGGHQHGAPQEAPKHDAPEAPLPAKPQEHKH